MSHIGFSLAPRPLLGEIIGVYIHKHIAILNAMLYRKVLISPKLDLLLQSCLDLDHFYS